MDEGWLREATSLERDTEKGHQDGNLVIWVQVNLSSDEPLRDDQVRKALTHLYRKTPSLGVCYGMRDGKMWFKKTTNPNVDFQVVKGVGIKEMRDIIRQYHFNSETGPLFCARLLQESPENVDIEDLDPLLPHKSILFFGIHHGPTDGNCNMHIIGWLSILLNDVLNNKPIDDNESFGTFLSDEIIDNLVMEKRVLIEKTVALHKKLAEEKEYFKLHTPLIIKGFPKPNYEEERTSGVVKVFDQTTTAKFIQKCKDEKVTVNSAITSIVNIAMVDTFVEYNFIQPSYNIQHFHVMNLRRYMNLGVPESLGLKVTFNPVKIHTETPKNIEGGFWEYARTIHRSIWQEIISERGLCDRAYMELHNAETNAGTETSPGPATSFTGDFLTSSLGDITNVVPVGDKVKVGSVIGGTSFHKTDYPVLITFNTYRGRLSIVYEYTHCLDASVAERICFNLATRLCEMTE